MRTLLVAPLLAAVMMCSGCDKTPAPQDAEVPSAGPGVQEEQPPAPAGQTESDTPAEPEVSVKILDWESAWGLAGNQTGRVVVMDLWSTYCPPCIAEFPNLVELHHRHKDDVACISVSLDYEGLDGRPVESYKPAVESFLKRQGATFENILLSTDVETLFNEKIEHGSMPVVYVFDRQGRLAGQFPDPQAPTEFTYEDQVLPLVEKLLAQH